MGRSLTATAALPSLQERAAAAARRSDDDPVDALRQAEAVLEHAVAEGDREAEAMALRAAGLALRERGDLGASQEALRRSAGVARRAGLPTREGEARLTLAHVLALAGRAPAGLREAGRAADLLSGPAAVRARAQQALIALEAGDQDAALDGFRRALVVFRRHRLEDDVTRVLMNRGVAHSYRGDVAAARADLGTAVRRYASAGHELGAAEAVHNLGFVDALAGDLPAALARYDDAAVTFRRLGVCRPVALVDRCDALLAAGLAADARAAAASAVAMARVEDGAAHAEALLARARAELAAGAPAAAMATARDAEQRFRRQARGPWAVLAAFVALRAEAAAGHTVDPAAACALAEELDVQGWGGAALDARLLAGQAALTSGDVEQAVGHLAGAARARRSRLAERRLRAWHAEALVRLATGRRRSALRALDAGLDVLDANRAALGSIELRAGAARHGAALAQLGIDQALASRIPGVVLRWAERARTAVGPGAVPIGSYGPEHDPALAELRATAWALDEATLAADAGAARLRRRRGRLEARVRERSLRAASSGAGQTGRPPGVRELRAALGDRALVELVASGGDLHAVVVTRRRAAVRSLCADAELGAEVAHLRFALRRLAAADAAPADRERGAVALRRAAARVGDLLLAPVLRLVGDAPVVVVPTGALHGVPWATLPGMRGRPVVVAPSASAWVRAQRLPPPAGDAGVALVAGPGLPGADREVAQLAAVHPGAHRLRGRAATVAAATDALEGAALAHLAAHGTFRGDNPRFSSLRLADGPLFVHDLERLHAPPAAVVVSACYAAEAVVTAGDEVVGLAGALLSLGSRTVVASVAPVPDEPSAAWMTALHRALAAGTGPAEALATTTGSVALDAAAGPSAALAGYACYGAG